MNIQSIILLAVILLVAAVVFYRYAKRQKRTGGCGSCHCCGESHCGLRKLE